MAKLMRVNSGGRETNQQEQLQISNNEIAADLEVVQEQL
jgi:hypothetical protein